MSTTDDDSHAHLAENSTRSTVKVYKVAYEWAIDNFDFCEAKGINIKSPEFSANAYGDVKWNLKLKPNGKTDSKDTIGLRLYLSENSEHKIIFAKFSASILDNEPKKEVSLTCKKVNKFVADGWRGWGWSAFCKKDENFRKKSLPNNVLKIYCEIMFSTESDAIEHQRFRNIPYPMSTFADRDVTENLDILFKTHLLSDVIISVQSKEYPAHKAILAARSKVFAAMFEHDTKDNQLNRIEIEDMNEETVGELLRFIYTGRCEKLNELAGDLLAAADKYNLDLLKAICTEALCDNLSMENAAQNLILADMHSADDLKSEAMNLIVSKPTEVFNAAEWRSVVTNPELIEEVCRAMARQLQSGDDRD